MKRASDLKLSQGVQRRQEMLVHERLMAAMANSSEPYELSPLEALPVELIQQIFFYSLEVNMPRASSHIAGFLSNSSIYSALILFAYFQEDGESPVEEQLFLPAQYRRISVEDKVWLQQSILSCRWCNLDFFKSCMPTLSRLQMVQAWHRETKDETKLDLPHGSQSLRNPGIEEQYNQALQMVAARPLSVANIEELARHYFAMAPSSADGDVGLSMDAHFFHTPLQQQTKTDGSRVGPSGHGNYLPRIITWNSYMGPEKQFYKSYAGSISILATRILPDSLLEGKPSWTRSKLELLMLLRQGARFLRPLHSERWLPPKCSANALYEGMTSAIKSHDSNALLVLLEIHSACMEEADPAADSLEVPQRLTVRYTSPVPLRLFHLACAQPYPVSSSLLSLLIREGIDSIPLDDMILTAWAVRNNRDKIASFLLRHMEGAYNYGARDEPRLFSNGRQFETPGLPDTYFPQMSFTTQIGYLTNPVLP